MSHTRTSVTEAQGQVLREAARGELVMNARGVFSLARRRVVNRAGQPLFKDGYLRLADNSNVLVLTEAGQQAFSRIKDGQ